MSTGEFTNGFLFSFLCCMLPAPPESSCRRAEWFPILSERPGPCIYEAFYQINTKKKVKERDIDFEMKSTIVCMYCTCAFYVS